MTPTKAIKEPMKNFSVRKRDGRIEPGDIGKIHKVCTFGCEGINGVSISELEMTLYPNLRDRMTTKEVNEEIVSACKTLISGGAFAYDQVGGRIISYIVRKEAYGKFQPPHLLDIVKRNIEAGRYDPSIVNMFSEDEWDQINQMIDHNRDELLRLAGAEQMRVKYLSKHRGEQRIFESFQIPFILVAAVTNANETDSVKKLSDIKAAYDAFSTFDVSLPTPIMSGVRTIMKQFASCVLIDVGDSLREFNAASSAIVTYVSNKAGLGVNVGRIRAIGSPIRGGEAIHTGILPFIKKFTADTKCCSQGGVRDGAVTFYYPMWHYETPELLVLKSNTLPEEQTNRRADYAVQINKFLFTRLIQDGEITLFSPHDVPDLYEAFFADQTLFAQLYEKYEKDASLRTRKFPAAQLFADMITQRSNSGRIYLSFVDHFNDKSSFKIPLYQSNLCVEISLPTAPLPSFEAGMPSEISICSLAAINWGNIEAPEDFEAPCRVAVRTLDALLDYQDYPVNSARASTMHRRPLGVGLIGFAHFLAKKGLSYNKASMEVIDRYAEAWSYYLIKASVELAKEKGPCPGWKDTKYADGWTPNLTRTKKLDELLPHEERMDWESLRADLRKYGIRNSTLMAGMPSETSSQISNETNGFEPPRGPVVSKGSKDVTAPIVVPEVDTLLLQYDYLWDMRSPRGYLEVTAVLQKYMDQAMSINTAYNPAFFPNGKLSTKVMLDDVIYAYQLGHKNLYYNTVKKEGEEDIINLSFASGCDSGGCVI